MITLKSASTTITASIRLALCVMLCLSLCTFSTCDLAQNAEAATLYRGDVSRASSEGIVLDANIHTKQPSFDKTVSTTTAQSESSIDTIYTYSYGLQVPAKAYQSLGTTINARWNDVGFDADDDRIDLVISWLPDSRWYSVQNLARIPLLQRYDHNGYNTAGICVGIDEKIAGGKTCCEQHLKVSFFKRGTTTPARGSFLTRFTDLDKPGWDEAYGDRWCESVEFISGHSNDMYIPNGNVLNIGKNRNNENATDYRATKEMDGSSLDSGVVVRLSHGSEFWYYSTRGWTDILDQFDVKSIALSSNAGGRVSCNNKTGSIPVGWRGGRTVSIRPSTGYKIADVKVDGNSIGARSSYTFTNVTTDHTISASFAPINFAIRFNANGANGHMNNLTIPYDSACALTANTFSRTGYRFIGWNTNPDGSGTTYHDEQVIRNLSSIDGTTIDLHAQWEPYTYTVIFEANGADGAAVDQRFTYDQSQTLAVNRFSRPGYLFGGWNTKSNGSGISYSNAQEVKNLLPTDDGKITLYAQWHPIRYFVAFEGQGGAGTMYDQVFTYDEAQELQSNLFYKKGFRWMRWDTNPSVPESSYEDCALVKNLTDQANEVIRLYAIWAAHRCLILFDKNGGTGDMETQSVAYGAAEKLHPNTFEREGWHWVSWNTEPDGSGSTFENEQEVEDLVEEDSSILILYAQWEPDRSENGQEAGEEDQEPNTGAEINDNQNDALAPVDNSSSSDSLQNSTECDTNSSIDQADESSSESATESNRGATTISTASDHTGDRGDKISSSRSETNENMSSFDKTGASILVFVGVLIALVVTSIAFFIQGTRRRKQREEEKRRLVRSLLGL